MNTCVWVIKHSNIVLLQCSKGFQMNQADSVMVKQVSELNKNDIWQFNSSTLPWVGIKDWFTLVRVVIKGAAQTDSI